MLSMLEACTCPNLNCPSETDCNLREKPLCLAALSLPHSPPRPKPSSTGGCCLERHCNAMTLCCSACSQTSACETSKVTKLSCAQRDRQAHRQPGAVRRG